MSPGTSDLPPIIGGKHGFKLKDVKASVNAWAAKPGNGGKLWSGKKKARAVK